MCICLKVSGHDWVSARHTSACITVLYVDFHFTRADTATMTDYRQLQETTFSDQRGRKIAPAAKLEHSFILKI